MQATARRLPGVSAKSTPRCRLIRVVRPRIESMAEFDIVTAESDHDELPPGSESDWIDVGVMHVVSDSISIGDAGYPSDPKTFRLPNGSYTLSIRQHSKDGQTFNTRVRVSKTSVYQYDCNLASFGIDSARVFVGDTKTVTVSVRRGTASENEDYFQRVCAVPSFGEVPLPGDLGATVWVFETGFGDGLYDVFSLVSDGELVGYETIFIGQDPPTLRERPVRRLP
jgi:hypothetical protein